MEQHDWPDFEYGLDETGSPSFFWKNPWSNHKREKIASLWWPEHPPEATEAVEALFDNLSLIYGDQGLSRDEVQPLVKALLHYRSNDFTTTEQQQIAEDAIMPFLKRHPERKHQSLPRTSKERESCFRADLASLLKKHRAELQVTDDGKPWGMHNGVCEVTMYTENDNFGNVTAEYTNFRL